MSEQQEPQNVRFVIERLYTKDISFESPHSPEIFRQEWSPNVEFDLNTNHKDLGEDHYEVVLSITVTAKVNAKLAFLVEVEQAGIFTIQHPVKKELDAILGSYCPTILFPYLRQVVSDLVSGGSFPPLYLSPLNFDAIYAEKLKQAAALQSEKNAQTNGQIQTDITH